MHRLVSISGKALAALLVAGAAAAAHASAGNGIRLGGSEGRLHPFFDVETRYDSNVSYTVDDKAVADVILHFRPGMELQLPGDLAALEFSGALDWAQYLGLEEDTSNLSRMYGGAQIAALFARRSPVSLRLDNDFQRRVTTTSLTAVSDPVVSNVNTFSVSVPWTPGGGALVFAMNGQWILEAFEKYQDLPDGAQVGSLSDLGYSQFRGGAELQWRFLPRTTALFDASYYSRVPNGSKVNAAGFDGEASGVDVTMGLTGLLTPRITATIKGGYGSSSTTLKDAASPIADVALEWLLQDSISFRAGYRRFFGVDPTISTFVADSVSAGARLKIADRFAFRAGIGWDRLDFRAFPGAETAYLRVDPTLEGTIGGWFSLGLGYVYSARTASIPQARVPDYSKNEAFLKLGLTY
ncbi:MAG TPA: hypothetical protein VFL83_10790 [Anaeromyxobacter sp.]|nr:hypothetical protein [Anaeromyxobacter sp.]